MIKPVGKRANDLTLFCIRGLYHLLRRLDRIDAHASRGKGVEDFRCIVQPMIFFDEFVPFLAIDASRNGLDALRAVFGEGHVFDSGGLVRSPTADMALHILEITIVLSV